MRNFNFNGNQVLTAEEFATMLQTDKGIREARYCLGYKATSDTATGHYVNWPSWDNVRDITDEQREAARVRFEERREEVRKKYAKSGTLFIVTMGGDYTPRTPDDIANYRVRAQFIDNAGDLRGVEFSTWKGDGFTFDRWNRSEEERNNDRYTKEMARLEKKYKGAFIPFEERPEFPMTYADRGTVKDLPYTTAGVLAWFEREQGMKFDRVYIDRFFFSSGEITSKPKKPRKTAAA